MSVSTRSLLNPVTLHRWWATTLAGICLLILSPGPCFAQNASIERAGKSIATQISEAHLTSVAVSDFTVLDGSTTSICKYVSETLTESLVQYNTGFEVIDRNHLNAILQENKLASTGLVNPATVKKLGQISSVKALVTGLLVPYGDSLKMTVKVIDTQTAHVIAAADADIPITSGISSMLGQISQPSPTEVARTTSEPQAPHAEPLIQIGQDFRIKVKGCHHHSISDISCTFALDRANVGFSNWTTNDQSYLIVDGRRCQMSKEWFGDANDSQQSTGSIRYSNRSQPVLITELFLNCAPRSAHLLQEWNPSTRQSGLQAFANIPIAD